MKHWLSDCSNKRRTHLKSAHIHLNTRAQDCLYPTHWSPVWFHQTGSAGLTEDLFVLSLCCLYVLSESCDEKCSHGYGLKAFTRAQTTRDRPPAAPQLAPGFPMSFLSPSVCVHISSAYTLPCLGNIPAVNHLQYHITFTAHHFYANHTSILLLLIN